MLVKLGLISGTINLQSKYCIRKHHAFLGWLNKNNLPIVLSRCLFFSWLTARLCITVALSLCYNLTEHETSDADRTPWATCVPEFSKSSLLGAASGHSRREAVFSAGLSPGTSVLDTVAMKRPRVLRHIGDVPSFPLPHEKHNVALNRFPSTLGDAQDTRPALGGPLR